MSRHISYRKMQTTGIGHVSINLTIPSGMDEAGSATDPNMIDSDGYLTMPDGYDSGVKGVLKVGTGLYDIVLWDQYYGFVSGQATLITTDSKALLVSIQHPPMNTLTNSSSETFNWVRVRVINTSAAPTDLEYNDSISVTLVMDRSSA